jgi:o-succinylbenzoate synthase
MNLTKETALANLKTFRIELNESMRGESYREGVLIKGDFGWSEFAPFAYHSLEHATRWLQAALEMAWTELEKPLSKQVAVNAISTSANPEKSIAILNETGCTTLKIKLTGLDINKDLILLKQIAQVKPETTFRIDFNGSLDVKNSLQYFDGFSDLNIEYVEQPCKTVEEVAELKKESQIKIAIDENLRLAPDSTDLVLIEKICEIADYVVLKPIPIGGINRFNIISEAVRKFGKKVVVSGSMDTSIGLYMSALAQSINSQSSNLVAGAGTGSMIRSDVVTKTVKPHNGVIDVEKLDIDESRVFESPNRNELLQRISQAFDYGKERNWF